jgi:hypothetical protein
VELLNDSPRRSKDGATRALDLSHPPRDKLSLRECDGEAFSMESERERERKSDEQCKRCPWVQVGSLLSRGDARLRAPTERRSGGNIEASGAAGPRVNVGREPVSENKLVDVKGQDVWCHVHVVPYLSSHCSLVQTVLFTVPARRFCSFHVRFCTISVGFVSIHHSFIYRRPHNM